MFKEINYRLNGTTVDTIRNPGVACLIKNLVSLSEAEWKSGVNSGFTSDLEAQSVDNAQVFEVLIPLKLISGFFEDFKRVLIAASHEISLFRQQDDSNCFIIGSNIKNTSIELLNIEVHFAKLDVTPVEKLKLLKIIEEDETIQIPFRSWILKQEYLTKSKLFDIFNMYTSTQLGKPRFAITAFQVARRNDFAKDNTKFDHIDLKNLKLFLNNEPFPWDDVNCKFPNNIALLYDAYSKFQSAYYDKNASPLLSLEQFKKQFPIFVIDACYQTEGLASSAVDCKLYYESHENFKDDTILYSLLLCDCVIEYNSFNGVVRKIT
jgi:hypothetical protein